MESKKDKDFFEENFGPDKLEIFKTVAGVVYITILGMTMAVLSGAFKDLLNGQHFKKFGFFPCKAKVQGAIEQLDMYGRLFAPAKKVFRRFAPVGAAIYIDLCTPDFAAVKITDDSVSIEHNPPAKFIRSEVQRTIGAPVLNAVPEYLELLHKYIPFKTKEDFILFVSWLLGCMNSDGGSPVLFLVGEQGSAKSTACRLIKDLLDGSDAALRNMPKTEKELMIAAINDFILCFDNTSKITDSQSDNLCKLATGSAFTTRKLYSTAAEVQLKSKNPCVINGIGCLPHRQDLLDRSIIVRLDFIAPEDRKTEKALMASWETDRPLIFGALCQAASAALKNYDSVSDRNLPRMADFAKWVIAAEEKLPWEKGQFMETMRSLRSKIVEEALESDPVAMAVFKLMENLNEWSGSATDLLETLEACIDQERKKYPGFPKIANHLSKELERLSAFLREKGIQIKRRHSGQRFIDITRIIEAPADVPAEDDTPMEKTVQVTEGFANAASNQLPEKTTANPEEDATAEEPIETEFKVDDF